MAKIKKSNIIISIEREQLLYDLKNLGYITRTAGISQAGGDEGHLLTDLGEGGNEDRVTRALDLAYADICRILAGYMYETVGPEEYADDEYEEDDYEYVLTVGSMLPYTAVKALKTYIHEYMVAFAMEDWTSITAPDLQQTWRLKLDELESKIKGAISYRKGGIRIKQHPF